MLTRKKVVRPMWFASPTGKWDCRSLSAGPGKAEGSRAGMRNRLAPAALRTTLRARLAGITVVSSVGGSCVPGIARYPAALRASTIDAAAFAMRIMECQCHSARQRLTGVSVNRFQHLAVARASGRGSRWAMEGISRLFCAEFQLEPCDGSLPGSGKWRMRWKPGWQRMNEKAPNELVGFDLHDLLFVFVRW